MMHNTLSDVVEPMSSFDPADPPFIHHSHSMVPAPIPASSSNSWPMPKRRERWEKEQIEVLRLMLFGKEPIERIAVCFNITPQQIQDKLKTETRFVRDGKRH